MKFFVHTFHVLLKSLWFRTKFFMVHSNSDMIKSLRNFVFIFSIQKQTLKTTKKVQMFITGRPISLLRLFSSKLVL